MVTGSYGLNRLLCYHLSFRRKTVSVAAVAKWPGNKLPIFKKDLKAQKELEELVEEITDECSYEPAGFDKDSIKQHILDVINERRRRHAMGTTTLR